MYILELQYQYIAQQLIPFYFAPRYWSMGTRMNRRPYYCAE